MGKFYCHYLCCIKGQNSLHFRNSYTAIFPALVSFLKIKQNTVTARLVLRNQYTQTIIFRELKINDTIYILGVCFWGKEDV